MKAYVLDTNVLVAAFRSDTGASRQVLEAARARRFDLLFRTLDAGIRISSDPS
jgi:predicted nucleic acid-binding protein